SRLQLFGQHVSFVQVGQQFAFARGSVIQNLMFRGRDASDYRQQIVRLEGTQFTVAENVRERRSRAVYAVVQQCFVENRVFVFLVVFPCLKQAVDHIGQRFLITAGVVEQVFEQGHGRRHVIGQAAKHHIRLVGRHKDVETAAQFV